VLFSYLKNNILFLNCNVLLLQYLNNNMSKETKKPKQPKTIRWGNMYERIKKVCDKQERSISDYVRQAVSIQLDKDGV
jgi:hypothetical protein